LLKYASAGSSQPCWKGKNNAKITALEEANGEDRMIHSPQEATIGNHLMRKKHAAYVVPWGVLVLGLLLLIPFATSGCGGGGASSGRNMINAGQFNVLQKARSEIGTMIQETSEALSPSLTLAQKRERVNEVLEKHKGGMPDPQSFPTQPNTQHVVATKKLQKTLEGQLNELVQAQGDSSAALMSQMYQRAFGDLYGLKDFEKYVAEHTVAEGAKINPSNPPDQMQTNAQQWFRRALSANITYNPATGDIKYILGEHQPDYMLSNATPGQIENQFILDAKYRLTEGDNSLLDDTKI
jgi:hypothetical protein